MSTRESQEGQVVVQLSEQQQLTPDNENHRRSQEDPSQRNEESLEQQKKSIKEHLKISESLEERMDKLVASALQFSQLYFVFQGVIISVTFSQAANPLCKFTWIPLSLSLMVSTFQLCGLLRIMLRFNSYYEERDKNNLILDQERARRNDVLAAIDRGILYVQPPSDPNDSRASDEPKNCQHRLIEFLIFAFFVAFTTIVGHGVYHISCRKKANN